MVWKKTCRRYRRTGVGSRPVSPSGHSGVPPARRLRRNSFIASVDFISWKLVFIFRFMQCWPRSQDTPSQHIAARTFTTTLNHGQENVGSAQAPFNILRILYRSLARALTQSFLHFSATKCLARSCCFSRECWECTVAPLFQCSGYNTRWCHLTMKSSFAFDRFPCMRISLQISRTACCNKTHER